MLVDILLEDDVIMLAKVVGESNDVLKVQYFVQTNKRYLDQRIYKYEDTIEEVDKTCVAGYYEDGSDESAAGFTYTRILCAVAIGLIWLTRNGQEML